MKTWIAVFAVILMLAAACGRSNEPSNSKLPAPEPDKPVITKPVPPGTGTIIGEVEFAGTPPAPRKLKVNKDNQACGQEKESEELVLGQNKGISSAVVSLMPDKEILAAPKPQVGTAALLNQQGCQFQPHVLLVPSGSTVTILNPDGILHNFHTQSKVNPPINRAQPKFKKEMTEKFEKPEGPFRMECDVHKWMSGWMVVTDHPFYTLTDKNGQFKLEGVPAGKRIIKIWHETLGELVQEVEIKDGQTTKVSYKMKT